MVRALDIPGRALFDAIPHYPIQIIMPQIMLVVSEETSDILAAGTLKRYRKLARERGESRHELQTWPKYYHLEFNMGLEPKQVQPTGDGESLILNASGMLKMLVIFDDLKQFLSGNSLNNAQRFLHHVAGDGEKGSVARYTLSQLDAAARWMIGR